MNCDRITKTALKIATQFLLRRKMTQQSCRRNGTDPKAIFSLVLLGCGASSWWSLTRSSGADLLELFVFLVVLVGNHLFSSLCMLIIRYDRCRVLGRALFINITVEAFHYCTKINYNCTLQHFLTLMSLSARERERERERDSPSHSSTPNH